MYFDFVTSTSYKAEICWRLRWTCCVELESQGFCKIEISIFVSIMFWNDDKKVFSNELWRLVYTGFVESYHRKFPLDVVRPFSIQLELCTNCLVSSCSVRYSCLFVCKIDKIKSWPKNKKKRRSISEYFLWTMFECCRRGYVWASMKSNNNPVKHSEYFDR